MSLYLDITSINMVILEFKQFNVNVYKESNIDEKNLYFWSNILILCWHFLNSIFLIKKFKCIL